MREIRAAYYAMIELLDDMVGGVLAALDRSGRRDDTLILFTSDYGEMLGDHGLLLKGFRFYEGLVKVPLLFSWPRRLACGVASDALVELVDVAPPCSKSPASNRRRPRTAAPCCGSVVTRPRPTTAPWSATSTTALNPRPRAATPPLDA